MFVTAKDGTKIGYSLLGDAAAGQRVALIHSLAMDREFWRPVAEKLSSECAVLIYDCRGHGDSGKPAGPYTTGLFADDLADLMDHTGWEKAAIAGASMGGTIAITFGQNYPQRTTGLGLFDTTAWYGATAPADWADRAQKAVSDGLASLAGFQKTRWFSDRFRETQAEVVERAIAVFLKNDVQAYASTCNMLGATDLRSGLASLKMPVRIAVGEEDYATPVVMSQSLQAALPGAPPLHIIKGGRHLTPLETPDVIAAEIRSLIAS